MRDCPSSAELHDFLSTTLPEGRAVSVRAHVSACDRCQDELDRLTDSEMLGDWRAVARPVDAGPGEEEPALARLRRELRATPPPAAFGDRDDDGGPSTLAGSGASEGEGPVDWRAVLGPPARPGDLGTLGPYLVEGELGRGGMGIVLRAYDLALERRVALKVLRPDLAHPRARRRLVPRVARAARACCSRRSPGRRLRGGRSAGRSPLPGDGVPGCRPDLGPT